MRYDKDLLPAASSDYGSYASESGYGHSCSSGYVNASAVALLAFLFLLNLVQNIVNQINGDGRRKRRDLEEGDWASRLANGIDDHPYSQIPVHIITFMAELFEASDEELSAECLAIPVCEGNAQISSKFGAVGRIMSKAVTNFALKIVAGDDQRRYNIALDAAKHGRNHKRCHIIKKECDSQKLL